MSATHLEEALRHLNHVSGCGWNTTVLRERILAYLDSHGGVDSWHDFGDVCKTTFAWTQFGKRVVDCLTALMVGAGEIEVDALPVPGMIRRLRPANPAQPSIFDKPVEAPAVNPQAVTKEILEAERQLAILRTWPAGRMRDEWVRKAEKRVADAKAATRPPDFATEEIY